MKLTITRIEKRIVTCELEDGTRIDIARRWFTDDLEEEDNIEFVTGYPGDGEYWGVTVGCFYFK